MSTLRNKLFAAGSKRPSEVVTVVANGEPLPVEVRSLSTAARGRVLNDCLVKTDDGNEMDQVKLTPILLIECAYDPATGTPLFTAADVEALGEFPAGFLDPIVMAATRLSALGETAAKEIDAD